MGFAISIMLKCLYKSTADSNTRLRRGCKSTLSIVLRNLFLEIKASDTHVTLWHACMCLWKTCSPCMMSKQVRMVGADVESMTVQSGKLSEQHVLFVFLLKSHRCLEGMAVDALQQAL